jgi:hypothetical protein
MNSKSKLAAIALVTAVGVASPAFARTAPDRHTHNVAPDRPGYGSYAYAPDRGVVSPSDPVNNPATTGAGSEGYNKYMGHAH